VRIEGITPTRITEIQRTTIYNQEPSTIPNRPFPYSKSGILGTEHELTCEGPLEEVDRLITAGVGLQTLEAREEVFSHEGFSRQAFVMERYTPGRNTSLVWVEDLEGKSFHAHMVVSTVRNTRNVIFISRRQLSYIIQLYVQPEIFDHTTGFKPEAYA
jgi:hypothetical protein